MNNVYKKNKLWLKYLALLCCALMFSFVTTAQTPSKAGINGIPDEWPGITTNASILVKGHPVDPQNSSTDDIWTGGHPMLT